MSLWHRHSPGQQIANVCLNVDEFENDYMPVMYQCIISNSVSSVTWSRYGVEVVYVAPKQIRSIC